MTGDQLKKMTVLKLTFLETYMDQIWRRKFLPTAVFCQMSNLFSRDKSLTDASLLLVPQ